MGDRILMAFKWGEWFNLRISKHDYLDTCMATRVVSIKKQQTDNSHHSLFYKVECVTLFFHIFRPAINSQYLSRISFSQCENR